MFLLGCFMCACTLAWRVPAYALTGALDWSGLLTQVCDYAGTCAAVWLLFGARRWR